MGFLDVGNYTKEQFNHYGQIVMQFVKQCLTWDEEHICFRKYIGRQVPAVAAPFKWEKLPQIIAH